MLILTRKPDESIKIGTDITLTILGVKGNQVRLGIAAPKNVDVHREEIYNRIKMEGGSKVSSEVPPEMLASYSKVLPPNEH